MELRVLSDEEYKKYALKSKYISIYQIPEWGDLKKTTGWIKHTIGVFDNNKCIGVTLLLEKKLPMNLSLYYSPRGYLTDVYNFTILKAFHSELIKYIKKHHGFMLKVDPNVIMNLRDSNGNIINEDGKVVYTNFKKLGFKHLGFTQNFETLQPRFLCRIKLMDTYNDTLNTFTKSTKKNIDKTYDYGVRVKIIDEKDIELFTKLIDCTAIDKGFATRPSSYYKKEYELMKDYITLYVAYIDTNLYYNYVYKSLENKKEELKRIEEESKKINVGHKIKQRLESLNNDINKLTNELSVAEDLKTNNDYINIGALMSIFINDEGITFMSGTNPAYKKFNPKYAFYRKHIEDSIEKKLKYVNFYGISGDLNPHNKYYGIYEMKKGFNPEITELIGEFDYIVNPFIYGIYKLVLKGYKIVKQIKK